MSVFPLSYLPLDKYVIMAKEYCNIILNDFEVLAGKRY
jgi:hypothetical protein